VPVLNGMEDYTKQPDQTDLSKVHRGQCLFFDGMEDYSVESRRNKPLSKVLKKTN